MNIDDLADNKTGQRRPGERFRNEWLDGLPVSQWPSFIDENARLVADGIAIGDTKLTKAEFPYETGEHYRRGLAATSNVHPEESSLPLGRYSGTDVGWVAWVFNRLQEEVYQSRHTDFEDPSRVIEAAINKTVIEAIETGETEPDALDPIRLPESTSVSTLVSEVFCRPRGDKYMDLMIQAVRQMATSGLHDHIDEPRLITELWEHQRTALEAWLAHDCRGHVDMATATGKTVLGLAAIAHHFGRLYPSDQDISCARQRPSEEERATVLVVAHRKLILDQWKREFDTHLNIPQHRSTQDGEHIVEFEWGDVHFWTPNRLQEAGVPDAELVVLDETHHYLGSSGFGAILDDIESDVLALSGSLDESNARTLERRGIPKIFEFSLQDGQQAGVIPRCEWDVVFSPYENQSKLAAVTQECRDGFATYGSGFELPDAIESEQTELAFETLAEARSLVQSSVGRELKDQDPEFREFASAVMARQMTQYNLSPTLSTVTRLVTKQIDQHKCVVLLETRNEMDRVTTELKTQLGEAYDSLVTVLDDTPDLQTVERFDTEQESGALIGIARTLGEGVDIETADVCINRGRGRLSRSLIQRMGRILRNPDGEKHARFYHVAGTPTQEQAILEQADGVAILETASQLLTWGEQFDARPVFAIDTETTMTERDLITLEEAGAAAIDEWTPNQYDRPAHDAVADQLASLCEQIRVEDDSALLTIERQESDHDSPTTDEPAEQSTPDDVTAVPIAAATNEPIAVPAWLHALVDAVADDAVNEFIEEQVRSYLRDSMTYPDGNEIRDMQTRQSREVTLNPALDALLSTYAGEEARASTVMIAVADQVSAQYVETTELEEDIGSDEIERRLTFLTSNVVSG